LPRNLGDAFEDPAESAAAEYERKRSLALAAIEKRLRNA
jgi:hypothetical protein